MSEVQTPGYRVAIEDGDAGTIEVREFPFGQWTEIGYFLDEHGYNQERYRVSITFREERD